MLINLRLAFTSTKTQKVKIVKQESLPKSKEVQVLELIKEEFFQKKNF